MSSWEKIFYSITLIIVLRVVATVIESFISNSNNKNIKYKIIYGLASRKDLAKLSGSSFISWTNEILKNIGFENVKIISENLKDNYQIKAFINEQPTYIKCAKLEQTAQSENGEEDAFHSVGRPELQKLVGTMEHDNIKIGYVITNGNFSSEAIEYASTMPAEYFLKTIDGCELTRLHRRNQEQYLTAKLD